MTDATPPTEPWDGLIDLLPVGLMITHFPTDDPADSYLVAANPAASAILGIDLAPLIGRSATADDLDERFDPAETAVGRQMSYDVAIGGRAKALEDFVIEHGPVKGHYQSTIFPMPGRRSGNLFRRIDREAAAAEALEWAMSSLATANRHLSAFASSVAHDLKNPLGGIAGNAELVKMTAPDLAPDAAQALDRVIDLARSSAEMVDGLLRFAHDSTELPTTTVDIRDVVAWVTDLLADQLDTGVVTLSCVGPTTVAGSEAPLRQVILNLVSNSVRYQHADRPMLITVEARRVGDQVTVEVSDNGTGIEPGMHERVFEWGVRNVEDEGPSGSGLGLAASRVAIDSLGGSIEVVASAAEGTTMRITLPAA